MLRRLLTERTGLMAGQGGHDYTQLATEDDLELEERGRKGSSHEKPVAYPKRIFFIIGMEACERFSYYGMRAILTIYLIYLLKPHYPDNEEQASSVATMIFHVFAFGSYASGLLGAALADSKAGKYRTILYIGILYGIGQAILAVGGLSIGNKNHMEPVSYIGIFLIAIGTGGIKPCVVALGADQFKLPQQAKALATYFAMFYASINIGSMVSTIAVPFLRRVPCLGEETCFSLAFGLPAGLMFLALILFWAGSWSYEVYIPKENIIAIFFKCSWHAFWSKRKVKGGHWLDKANDRFPQKTIDDIKAVYRVGVLFLFYPMYWALYDQQGTRWTIQAMKMNGDTFGWTILPDQMTVANPILIIILIPLFDQVLYPVMGKLGILRTPLQRIVTGCFLCGVAFVVSGILELELRKGYPVLAGEGEGKVILHNSLAANCNFELVNQEVSESSFNLEVKADDSAFRILPVGAYNLQSSCLSESEHSVVLTDSGKNLLIGDGATGSRFLYQSAFEDELDKSIDDPMPSIRLITNFEQCDIGVNVTIQGPTDADTEDQKTYAAATQGIEGEDFEAWKLEAIGEYSVEVKGCREGWSPLSIEFERLEQGGNYNLVLVGDIPTMVWYRVTEPNSIHIFWLLPQYLVISICEVLFSITSLEFAYSQAPTTMKSVLQSLYLMTTAVGNLITVLIVEIFLAIGWEQYVEFFTFAGLMFLFSFALMAVAYRYKYVYYTAGEKDDLEIEGEQNSGYEAESSEAGSENTKKEGE